MAYSSSVVKELKYKFDKGLSLIGSSGVIDERSEFSELESSSTRYQAHKA